jgi:hypothetical protein
MPVLIKGRQNFIQIESELYIIALIKPIITYFLKQHRDWQDQEFELLSLIPLFDFPQLFIRV